MLQHKKSSGFRKQSQSLVRRTSHKRGLPPGSVVHIGEQTHATELSVIQYSKEIFREEANTEVLTLGKNDEVSWYNIVGLTNTEFINKIGEFFQLHPLVREDIANTTQRPKVEDFETYTYLVLRMLYIDTDEHMQAEQVSLVLGPNFVLSFQERKGDVFDAVRERLRNAKGKIRQKGADHLFYSLIDSVVDNYFSILEKINDQLESLEDNILDAQNERITQDLYLIKRNLVLLRKSIWPLREVLSSIVRGQSHLIKKETITYFRDVYDHSIQVMDTIEALQQLATSIREMHITEISHRMNSIMKVLTIIATVFIPLTFVAGIYGMNFQVMPELHWKYGYLFVWIVFLAMAMGMFWFFRRKKWL